MEVGSCGEGVREMTSAVYFPILRSISKNISDLSSTKMLLYNHY